MWVTLDKGTEIMIFSGKNFYPKYYYVIQYGNTSVLDMLTSGNGYHE